MLGRLGGGCDGRSHLGDIEGGAPAQPDHQFGAVLAGRAPRCTLPVLTIALLPVLYALNPLADNAGQGRYALFAVPLAALLTTLVLATGPDWRPARGRERARADE